VVNRIVPRINGDKLTVNKHPELILIRLFGSQECPIPNDAKKNLIHLNFAQTNGEIMDFATKF
jgi:hypothetical protein